MIVKNKNIENLISDIAKIEVDSRDTYQIDGKKIPRVTEVLSAMLHEDFLLDWANGLGWKRISYRGYMREAAEKGTYSHLAIQKYLENDFLDLDELRIPNDNVRDVVQSAMDGFLQWWIKLHREHKEVEVVFTEEPLIHPYFSGTCDCLLKVDGKYWLIDFKTSNHMSYNYALQLSAYKYLLKELKNIEVSKCMILILSKTDHSYQTYELDIEQPEYKTFTEDALQTFMTLVAGYKMRLYTTKEYHDVFHIEPYKPKNKK